MAYNSAGEGPQSEHFRERTFKKAPLRPPTTVNVIPVNPSTVGVTWRYVAPGPEEEPLQGLVIYILMLARFKGSFRISSSFSMFL